MSSSTDPIPSMRKPAGVRSESPCVRSVDIPTVETDSFLSSIKCPRLRRPCRGKARHHKKQLPQEFKLNRRFFLAIPSLPKAKILDRILSGQFLRAPGTSIVYWIAIC